MRPTTIAIIVSVAIIVVYVIYIFESHKNNLYPFTLYEAPSDSNMVQYNPDPTPLDDEEIQERRQTAANMCAMLANTQNFVSLWCADAPTSSGIDCSNI